MTEKQYCGQCQCLQHKGIKNELPVFYCPIIKKEVSLIGYTCPDFKERQRIEINDIEIVEIDVRK